MDALLIRANGEATFITPKNGKDFKLDELYKHIGCDCIEIVYPMSGENNIIILDEEGKLKNKRINVAATELWFNDNTEPFDFIVGDVIFCRTEMVK